MSTAIPPNPNAIIRALLDIAQAAYVLIHSPSKEMGDNLRVQMALLEELPQYCNNPVNGPCRARKYLESFLVGGSTLTTIAADVQRDGIEFEAQVWKAPATGPGFTPTAEFPASGPISHDFYTHRSAWRDIIVKCIEQTKAGRTIDHERDLMDIEADTSYLEHELRAFDRAMDSLPPLQSKIGAPAERRMRPRFVEPIKPEASDTRPIVDATRPLFEKAMKSHGYRTEIDELGLYKGLTEHRWDGWRDAVETMGFRTSEAEDIGSMREARAAMDAVCNALTKHVPGWQVLTPRGMDSAVQAIEQLATTAKNEIRTNMLADTADEALRIINDADVLKNLVELFTMRDPGTSVTIREQIPHLYEDFKWKLDIMPRGDRAARTYESTSIHQVIVVAHKGEQDHEYPEPEMCAYCGMSFETPCDAPPTGPCEQANNAFHGSDPTKPRPPAPAPETPWTADAVRAAQHAMDNALMLTGRERATTLLVTIKEIMGVPAAKNIINAYGPGKLNDIPDTYLNNVIAAAEEVLKKVVE